MKKLFALLLAAVLLCSAALADVYSFGDFNLDIDPDMPGGIGDKADGQMLLYLYPNYNDADIFHANINVVWLEAVEDLTAKDPEVFAGEVLIAAGSTLTESGIAATNPVLYIATADEHQGVPAISAMYSYDCDFSGVGVDLQCTLYYLQFVVSVENIGSYTFTLTTSDFSQLESMMEILNTLTWNF